MFRLFVQALNVPKQTNATHSDKKDNVLKRKQKTVAYKTNTEKIARARKSSV